MSKPLKRKEKETCKHCGQEVNQKKLWKQTRKNLIANGFGTLAKIIDQLTSPMRVKKV